MPSDFPDSPVIDRRLRAAVAGSPSAEAVTRIQQKLNKSLRPVRPLPSDSALVIACVAAFVLLSAICAEPAGFFGFETLSMIQKLVVYGCLLVSATLLAMAVVNQMIPGSKRRVPPLLAVLFPIFVFAIAVPLLFPSYTMNHFVRTGFPCLRIGVI
jgi:hypothetical protein